MRRKNCILVEKHEVKISLGRPRRGRKYNTKMSFAKIGLKGENWKILSQDMDM